MLLERLLEPRAEGAFADHFWEPSGVVTESGLRIDSATALTLSTVYACVRIISNTLAMLPFKLFENKGNGRRDEAKSNPLYDVLHTRPNRRQTPLQFRQMMMGHMLLRGNAYSKIERGMTGEVSELLPLNPDRMRVELLETGNLRYRYQPARGGEVRYLADEILHFPGLVTDDGITGISTISLARESFGMGKAAERYGARFFGNAARPSGVLQHPKTLSADAHARLTASWNEKNAGPDASAKTIVLEEGMEWQALGVNNDDAQFLQTRTFQSAEVAQWFGVPLELLQLEGRTTTWGTGIEQLIIGFLTFTMGPWFSLWEQSVDAKLVIDPRRHFSKFILQALLRGDSASRSSFYTSMFNIGAMSSNEIREREDMPPIEGGDAMLTPLNMRKDEPEDQDDSDDQPPPQGGGPGPMPPDQDAAAAWRTSAQLAQDAGARIVRGEIGALERAAKRLAGDEEGWSAWVTSFYGEHVEYVVEQIHLGAADAAAYCAAQRDELLESGISVLERWERDRPAQLGMLILGGTR